MIRGKPESRASLAAKVVLPVNPSRCTGLQVRESVTVVDSRQVATSNIDLVQFLNKKASSARLF